MSISFVVAGAGALGAMVLLGLFVRTVTRVPRADLVALLCAATGVTVALLAQVPGYYRGFGPITFRAIQIGARLVAPVALAWALTEMTGKRFGARFVARLGLSALTVVAAVVLASDPLGTATFTRDWPSAKVYYQIIPNGVLDLTAAATALAALVAVLVASVRARRNPAWRNLLPAIAAAATATLATDALREHLPANSAYPLVCLIAVALIWFSGRRSATMSLTALHEDLGPAWNDQRADYGDYGYDSGYQGYSSDAGSYQQDAGGPEFDDWFRTAGAEGAGVEPGTGDADSGGWYGQEDSYPGQGQSGTGYGPYADDTGFGPEGFGPEDADFGREPPGAHRADPGAGVSFFETGDMLPVIDGYPPPDVGRALDGQDTSRFYGQIAIYTLLEGREQEFDRLAEQVVDKVKSREPDTIVYVMHAVPSAPLQRILYAAYRTEAAFAEHSRHTYIREFEEARKSFVLATNVIELGVRHAMFSPPAQAPRPASHRREPRPLEGGS